MKPEPAMTPGSDVDLSQPFGLKKTVYSYVPPEVLELIDAEYAARLRQVLLQSVKPAGALGESLQEGGAQFGLDSLERPVLEQLVSYLREHVTGLEPYRHRYWTAGSHEGIAEFMTFMAASGLKTLCTLEGEYEGFSATAATRGIESRTAALDEPDAASPERMWFVSDPNAADGNYLPDGSVSRLAERGHRIFLDLSYLAATYPRRLDVSHPNIRAVAISFSKPFGAFYLRLGALFSREAVPSLYGNIWFKSVPAIVLAQRVMDRIKLGAYVARLKGLQGQVVGALRAELGYPFKASDAFLLAHLDLREAEAGRHAAVLRSFSRGKSCRFCLTPRFLALDRPEWVRELLLQPCP